MLRTLTVGHCVPGKRSDDAVLRRRVGPKTRDVFRYVPGDVTVGNIGDTSYMRRGYEPGGCRKTRVRIQRLLGEYIERRARHMPPEEGFHKCVLADQTAPRWVDDAGPRGEQCYLAFTDHIARPGTQGQTKEQVLAPFEEGLQVLLAADPLQTKSFRQPWFGVALQSYKMHSERLEPHRQCLSDAAE